MKITCGLWHSEKGKSMQSKKTGPGGKEKGVNRWGARLFKQRNYSVCSVE